MNRGKKISILGAGKVGATIAYTLVISGIASEIVLIDIDMNKAKGEVMDIQQGTPFTKPVNIYAGDYADTAGSDIVIITMGMARKPGQSRLDLAQVNIDIVKSVLPQLEKYAPQAVYVVVTNPVDIITYAVIKNSSLPATQIFGSGTMLDSARLRSRLATHVSINPQNVHAYVLGEHGDSSVIPWSLTTIAGMQMNEYCCNICNKQNMCGKVELHEIEEDVRTAGAKVISNKGATYYAIAVAVRRICECILSNAETIMSVSGMLNGEYGISDVCLSLPFVVGGSGIKRVITPVLLQQEEELLRKSASVLKETIQKLKI